MGNPSPVLPEKVLAARTGIGSIRILGGQFFQGFSEFVDVLGGFRNQKLF
jgi:hypothetical protein